MLTLLILNIFRRFLLAIFDRTKQTAIERGMSIKELETQAELPENTIYNWKRSSPKVETVAKVSKVLQVSVDYLLGNVPKISILEFNTDVETEWYDYDVPEAGGENTYYHVLVKRETTVVDPDKVHELNDDDEVEIDVFVQFLHYPDAGYDRSEIIKIPYSEISHMDEEQVYKKYESYQIKIINKVRLEIDKQLKQRLYKEKHVDLLKLVLDEDRNKYADANGHKLSIQDWTVMYQVLAKYGKDNPNNL